MIQGSSREIPRKRRLPSDAQKSGPSVLGRPSLLNAGTMLSRRGKAFAFMLGTGGQMRSFKASLVSGHSAERKWVEGQRKHQRSVAHGKKLVLDSHNKNTDHCPSPDAVGLFAIEIKERNLNFSCPSDFPYETVFVDDSRGLSRETIRPLCYVFVSQVTGHWVWLTTLDRDATWKEKTVKDCTRGHLMGMLVAPKSHLRKSDELLSLLFPHTYLSLIDGDTSTFLSGGGVTHTGASARAEADSCAAQNNTIPTKAVARVPAARDKRVGR